MTPTLLRLSLITAFLSAALITVMNLIGATIPTRMAIYTSLDWITYGLFDTRTCISKISNVLHPYAAFAWSPNGDQIAVVPNINNQHDLYVMDWTGANLRPLANSPQDEVAPAWTPDNRLAFSSAISGNHTLYTIDLESRTLTPIIDMQDTQEYQIAFHPHLNYAAITVKADNSDYTHLELLNLETQATTRITPPSLYNTFAPLWSPDGTRLIYNETNSIINMITFSADLSTHTAPEYIERTPIMIPYKAWLSDDEILIGIQNINLDPLRFSVIRLQPTEYSRITYAPVPCLPQNAQFLELSP